MTPTLPAPLVPAEVDLTDFEFMPLKVARLRRSKEWLLAKKMPALGFYAMNLWAASWHERPAASIEDDDDVLADFAMCSLPTWKKVRDKVLRKWIKCSDGRLYHPIVAEVALESWGSKVAQRSKTAAATAARSTSRQRHVSDNHNDTTTSRQRVDNVTVPSRSPSEVKRSGSEGILNREVVQNPDITREAQADVTGNGAIEYPDKSKANGNSPGQAWNDPAWVAATAQTFGVAQRQGEAYAEFRDRTFDAVRQRQANP